MAGEVLQWSLIPLVSCSSAQRKVPSLMRSLCLHKRQMQAAAHLNFNGVLVTCTKACMEESHRNDLYWHAISIPPNEMSVKLGARVEHILVDKRGRLSETIERHLKLPQASICSA